MNSYVTKKHLIGFWQKAQNRFFTKIIAMMMAAFFVLPLVSWAFDGQTYQPATKPLVFHNQAIELDPKLVQVEQTQENGKQIVIYIQDLHCQAEVQNHIAELIAGLSNQHGVKLVAVEGAAGQVDVSRLAKINDSGLRQDIGQYLMQQGKITGTEYLAATSPRPVQLQGIEDIALYEKNLATVLKFLNDETQGYLMDLREALEVIKTDVYNPALKALDGPKIRWRNNQLALVKYAAFLQNQAASRGMQPENYPMLQHYLRSQTQSSIASIDSDQLYAELEILDMRLREGLYTTAPQRELDRLLERLQLIDKLLNVSALPEELERFRRNPEELLMRQFIDFISQHPAASEYLPDIDTRLLEQSLSQVRDFYRVADLRSQAFVDNTLKLMQQTDNPIAVLVTGGFHSKEILEQLARRNVSYISVRPIITRQDVVNPYFARLRGDKLPLEKLLTQKETLLAPRLAFYSQEPSFLGMVDTLASVGQVMQKIKHPGTPAPATIAQVAQAAQINPATGTVVVDLDAQVSAVLRPKGNVGQECRAAPGCTVELAGMQATLMAPAALAPIRQTVLTEEKRQTVGLNLRAWLGYAGSRMQTWLAQAAATGSNLFGRQAQPMLMSILPPSLVIKICVSWFGEKQGPVITQSYLYGVGPLLETLLFPLVAAGIGTMGIWWATIGFAFAHTIIAWVVRSREIGWRRALTVPYLLLDLRDFLLRAGMGYIFLQPFHSPVLWLALVKSFVYHSLYNALAGLFNTVVIARIKHPAWRKWLTLPLAILGFTRNDPSANNPAAETVRDSATAFEYQQEEFKGVDWEHFVHAQEILSKRSLTETQISQLLQQLQTRRSEVKGEFYSWLYGRLAEGQGQYSKQILDIINADSYTDPRLGVTVFGQNKRPRAQAVYEAVSNCLDALGMEIGQFGKGVKQAVDWLEPTGRDKIEVYTRQGNRCYKLTILQDTKGQNYIQIQTISSRAIRKETGQELDKGTIVSVSVKNAIPRTQAEADNTRDPRHRVTQQEIIDGIHKRFPFVTWVDMRTRASKDSGFNKVNGFSNKTVIVPANSKAASGDAKDRKIRVEVLDHKIIIQDNGVGMDAPVISRMFVPRQGSKQTPPLSGADAVKELAKVKVVQDETMPRRMSFSRNGEVIVAVDIPAELADTAAVTGGLMLEFGRLLDVPESRDKIIIPTGLDPNEEPNFQKAVLHAVAEIIGHPKLSPADKARTINTIVIGLEGLVGSNAHYEHAVSVLLTDIRKAMSGVTGQLHKQGYVLLPHDKAFEKINTGNTPQKKVIYLHEQIFDWQGAYSLKSLGGEIVPGISLGGDKKLALVVVPFKPAWVRNVARFKPEWATWQQADRLPLIKTSQFIAVPNQLGGRLLELSQQLAAGKMTTEQADQVRQEMSSLAERINIITAEKVVTHYEVATPEQNLGIDWQMQFTRSEGEVDSQAVNNFLTQLPNQIISGEQVAGQIPRGAKLKVALKKDGTLVEIGTGKIKRTNIQKMEQLPNGFVRLESANEIEITNLDDKKTIILRANKAAKEVTISPDRRVVLNQDKRDPQADFFDGNITYLDEKQEVPQDDLEAYCPRFSGKQPYFSAINVHNSLGDWRLAISTWEGSTLRKRRVELGYNENDTDTTDLHDYQVSPFAPAAYLELTKEKLFIDLQRAIIPARGEGLEFHTDSTGKYTVIKDKQGKLRVYLHDTGAFLATPSPILWVSSDWLENESQPRMSVLLEGGETHYFDSTGLGQVADMMDLDTKVMRGTAYDMAGTITGFVRNGSGRQYYKIKPQGLPHPQEENIYMHPLFNLLIDQSNPAQTLAKEPDTGKEYIVKGEIISHDPGRGITTNLNGSIYRAVNMSPPQLNADCVADRTPAHYAVIHTVKGPLLINLQKTGETTELDKIVPAGFTQAMYDGKFFVFTNPATGDAIYLDPADPQAAVVVNQPVGKAQDDDGNQPHTDAKQQYLLTGQGQVVDLRTGLPLPGVKGVKKLTVLAYGYLQFNYADGSKELVHPAKINNRYMVTPDEIIVASPDGRFVFAENMNSGELNGPWDLKKPVSANSLSSMIAAAGKNPARPVKFISPVFSADSKYLVLYKGSDFSDMTLVTVSLAEGDTAKIQGEFKLDRVANGNWQSMDVNISPYANLVFVENIRTRQMAVINLEDKSNPLIIEGEKIRVRTDPSGTYTSILLEDGEMMIYMHQSKRVITKAHVGGKITAVTTSYETGTGNKKMFITVDNTKDLDIDDLGNTSARRDFANPGFGETYQNNGELLVYSEVPVADTGNAAFLHSRIPNSLQRARMGEDELFKHPTMPYIWIKGTQPGKISAYDAEADNTFAVQGKLLGHVRGFGKGDFVFYKDNNDYLWTSTADGKIEPAFGGAQVLAYDNEPMDYLVFVDNDCKLWLYDRANLSKYCLGIRKDNGPVAYDGKYFVFQDPLTNSITFLDPMDKDHMRTLQLDQIQAVTSQKPDKAPRGHEIVFDDATKKYYLRNAVTGMVSPQAFDELEWLGDGYLVGCRAGETNLELISPDQPGNPGAVTGPFVERRGQVMVFYGTGGKITIDGLHQQITPKSGGADEVLLGEDGHYSLRLQGNLVYVNNHWETDPDGMPDSWIIPLPVFTANRFTLVGNTVMFEGDNDQHAIYSLSLGKYISTSPVEWVDRDSSGLFTVIKASGAASGIKLINSKHETAELTGAELHVASDALNVYVASGGQVRVFLKATGEQSPVPISMAALMAGRKDKPPLLWEKYDDQAKGYARWDEAAQKFSSSNNGIAEYIFSTEKLFAETGHVSQRRLQGKYVVERHQIAQPGQRHSLHQLRILDLDKPVTGLPSLLITSASHGELKSLQGDNVFYVRADNNRDTMVWAQGQWHKIEQAQFSDDKAFIAGKLGGKYVLIDKDGKQYDITAQTQGMTLADSNGDFFVLFNAATKETKYLNPVVVQRMAKAAEAAAAALQKGLSTEKIKQEILAWEGNVLSARDGLIAAARSVFQPVLAAAGSLPDAIRENLTQALEPQISQLYQQQAAEIEASLAEFLAGKKLAADDPTLLVNQSSQRMQKLAVGLAEFIRTAYSQVEQERDLRFRALYYERLVKQIMELALRPEISLKNFSADHFAALAMGFEIKSTEDVESLPVATQFAQLITQQGRSGMVVPAKIMAFLSQAAKSGPEKRRIIEQQMRNFYGFYQKNPEMFNIYLDRLLSAFRQVADSDLANYAQNEANYLDLGDAKDFAYYLTHDVQPVREREREIPQGRDVYTAVQGQGLQLSQIMNLEKQRAKAADRKKDLVMDMDYLLTALQRDLAEQGKMPAPSVEEELSLIRYADVQREGGAYPAEIAQNSLDATRGKAGELVVDFYRQKNGAQMEYVEEAQDNGTGALHEVALLIPMSTKAAGGQIELAGVFGTGKYTIFQEADRVEIITKNQDRAYLFAFVVERDTTGRAKAIRLNRIREVKDETWPQGVTIRRIKKAENTIPELDQTLAQRTWKTFAGLSQFLSTHTRFSISFKDQEGKPQPMALKKPEILSALPMQAATADKSGQYPELRIVAAEDMPMQIVDKVGLRVTELKNEYLALIPEKLRTLIKELNLSIQIPLPLIRDRSGFEHEDQQLPEIQKYVAVAFYQALAYKTLTQKRPEFTFEGFPRDWETNDHYWHSIDPLGDSRMMKLKQKINDNAIDKITRDELERLLSQPEDMVAAERFVKLIIMLEVPTQPDHPENRISLMGRRLAIQAEIDKEKAELMRRRLGVSRSSIPGREQIDFFQGRVKQARGIEEAHIQMQHPEKYAVEPETPQESELMQLAQDIARHFGIKKIVLMSSEVAFAGAFRGDTMYLNRTLARKIGFADDSGVDRATSTVVHELAHLLETLMQKKRISLNANEIYIAETAEFTHQAVGLFAEAMKYISAISLTQHKAKVDLAGFTPADKSEGVSAPQLSIIPPALVYAKSIEWFGPQRGPKLARIYLGLIGPLWETAVLALLAGLALGLGPVGIALGFAAAHTLVAWLERSRQIGWRRTFAARSLLQDARDFIWRVAFGYLLFLPLAGGMNLVPAFIISYTGHVVYNLAADFYNRYLLPNIENPVLRFWLKAPVAALTTSGQAAEALPMTPAEFLQAAQQGQIRNGATLELKTPAGPQTLIYSHLNSAAAEPVIQGYDGFGLRQEVPLAALIWLRVAYPNTVQHRPNTYFPMTAARQAQILSQRRELLRTLAIESGSQTVLIGADGGFEDKPGEHYPPLIQESFWENLLARTGARVQWFNLGERLPAWQRKLQKQTWQRPSLSRMKFQAQTDFEHAQIPAQSQDLIVVPTEFSSVSSLPQNSVHRLAQAVVQALKPGGHLIIGWRLAPNLPGDEPGLGQESRMLQFVLRDLQEKGWRFAETHRGEEPTDIYEHSWICYQVYPPQPGSNQPRNTASTAREEANAGRTESAPAPAGSGTLALNELQREQKWFGSWHLGVPLIRKIPRVFQLLPSLRRIIMVPVALAVALLAGQLSPEVSANINQLPAGRTIIRQRIPQTAADIIKGGNVSLAALSLEANGLLTWLKGQLFGHYQDTDGKSGLIFYLPEYVCRVLRAGENQSAGNRSVGYRLAYWLADNMVAHQNQLYLGEVTLQQVSMRAQNQELDRGQEETGFTPMTAAAGRPLSLAAAIDQSEGEINLTQAQLSGLLWQTLSAVERNQVQQELAALAGDWQQKEPGVQTLLNSLERANAAQQHPLLLLQKTLLLQARTLPLAARQAVERGVLANLIQIQANAAVSLDKITPVSKRQAIRVMGMPRAEAQALLAALGPLQAQATGSQAALLAGLAAALTAASGQPLADTVDISLPAAVRQLLAGALAQSLVDQGAVLGEEYNQKVYGLQNGVEKISLPFGEVAVPQILEVASLRDDLAGIANQIQQGRFNGGNSGRVFKQRALAPAKAQDRLPRTLVALLLNMVRLMPENFGWKNALAQQLLRSNPVQAYERLWQDLPPVLQQTDLMQALRRIDLQSQDPLAAAFRQMAAAPSPPSRQKFAKIMLNVLRQEKLRRSQNDKLTPDQRDAAEALDWLAVSEAFTGLGGLPVVKVAKADALFGREVWQSLPAEFRHRTINLPVVLFNLRGGKGALGFAVNSLDRLPAFSVDHQVIRLFLRKAIQRFSAAA